MGQRSPKKIWFSWLLAAALMIPAAGLAETPSPITIAGFDIRYEPLEGELCLTKEEIPEEAPPLLGADEAAIRRAMEAGSLYLLILTADGRQVSLRIAPASGMASPSGLPAAEGLGSVYNEGPLGEQALHLLQRDGGYRSAAWLNQAPGYALLSTMENTTPIELAADLEPVVSGENARPAGLHTIALATLHRNLIISFQTDIFGRAPSAADEDMLIAAAGRTILPDIQPEEEQGPLVLPPQGPLTDENVVFSYVLGTPPIEIVPFPAVVGSTSLFINGHTAPNGSLKYSVNGRSSSRFKADADGSFSVTMKNLTPDTNNEIIIFAYGNGSASTAACNVYVRWQPTPIVLSQTTGTVREDRMTLQGITLPGAKVQLIRKLETVSITVQKDGSFVYSPLLKKIGENTFTIRALAQGYKRTEVEVSITRVEGVDNP